MRRIFSLGAIFTLLFTFSLGAYAQEEQTISAIIADEADFSILQQLLDAAGLAETLGEEELEFTVFAPTDEAFEELFEEFEITLDELLAEPDIYTPILLYHVVEEAVLSSDLEDGMELETVHGDLILVTINSADEIILDEVAVLLEADITASNGVIHIIDRVLLPEESEESSSSNSGENCVVFTEEEGVVQVRVGPGENRTSVTFMPANVDVDVLGQTEDDEGNIWFQVDKETAAPGRAINEAWVSADAVETTGNCDDVSDAAAPPIIPISNQPPPVTNNSSTGESGGETGETNTEPDTAGQIQVQTGSWTEVLAANFDASCAGTNNVSIPTSELFTRTSFNYSLSRSGDGFVLGGVTFTYIGDNTYQAVETIGSVTGTSYIRVTAANRMESRFIFSFRSGNTTCSATVYSTISR